MIIRKTSNISSILFFVLLFSPSFADANSGRLDAYGCHYNRKSGEYICYRGQFSGRGFASQSDMLAILDAKSTTPKASTRTKRDSLPQLPATMASPKTATIDVAFSPYGESLTPILSSIEAAEKTILVAAYSFTSKPIAQALRDAHKRGVNVQVVADAKGNSGKYTAVTFLANQGVPVRLNSQYAIHHHKFMVIDGQHVQTGSFNYSAAAVKKNAENVLIVRGHPALAGRYAAEWKRLWGESVDVRPNY